jgi:DNA-binding SARP family transcriptional activator
MARARSIVALRFPVSDCGRRVAELCETAFASGQPPDDPDEAAALAALIDEAFGYLSEGPFLAWSDSPWAVVSRARYLQEGQRLGMLGVKLYTTLQRHDELVWLCRRVIALDPFDEQGWAALMRFYVQSGRSAEAMAAFREYAAILSEELGIAPSLELRRLVATARA